MPEKTLLRIRLPDGWRITLAKINEAEIAVDSKGLDHSNVRFQLSLPAQWSTSRTPCHSQDRTESSAECRALSRPRCAAPRFEARERSRRPDAWSPRCRRTKRSDRSIGPYLKTFGPHTALAPMTPFVCGSSQYSGCESLPSKVTRYMPTCTHFFARPPTHRMGTEARTALAA